MRCANDDMAFALTQCMIWRHSTDSCSEDHYALWLINITTSNYNKCSRIHMNIARMFMNIS